MDRFRITPRLARPATLVVVIGLLAAVVGCPKHEDFPTALDLVVPPTPNTFVINYVGPNPQGGFDYDLTWSVADPTNVDHYRLYLLDVGPAAELVAETNLTTYPVTFQFRITDLRLAVSTVSPEGVEGEWRTQTAP
jgi:hypothetical protein